MHFRSGDNLIWRITSTLCDSIVVVEGYNALLRTNGSTAHSEGKNREDVALRSAIVR